MAKSNSSSWELKLQIEAIWACCAVSWLRIECVSWGLSVFVLLIEEPYWRIFTCRSQLFALANTPRSPDQRRLFNAPMEDQDVPTAFGIASFEHSWLRSKRLWRRFSRSLSKRSAKGWSQYGCFGCLTGRTCISGRNSCTYLKTSFYEIMRLDCMAKNKSSVSWMMVWIGRSLVFAVWCPQVYWKLPRLCARSYRVQSIP